MLSIRMRASLSPTELPLRESISEGRGRPLSPVSIYVVASFDIDVFHKVVSVFLLIVEGVVLGDNFE
jgi:hypothetical protein